MARRGTAQQGAARQGKVFLFKLLHSLPHREITWHGVARHGKAWLGEARIFYKMKTQTKVMKLGGSYAVIIPALYRKHLGLDKGTPVIVQDTENSIIIYKA